MKTECVEYGGWLRLRIAQTVFATCGFGFLMRPITCS
jgi:hypothetical protein